MGALQSSNLSSLSIAEETTPGVLPGTPIWVLQSPNTFSDFGGEYSTVARETFRDDRQRLKGRTVDLSASGGFNTDLTKDNLFDLMQGAMFADVIDQLSTKPLNGTAIPITAVDATGDTYAAASGLGSFLVGDLIVAEDFTDAANNGLKRVNTVAAALLTVDEALATETPSATAAVSKVGYQFTVDTVDFDASGTLPILTRVGAGVDWTTIGVAVGDWLFVGGDTTALRFAGAANNGFGRVSAVAAGAITFDKFDTTVVTEAAGTGTTGLTIQIFQAGRINNATSLANIVERSYNLERTLGDDGSGTQSEYITGAEINELTFNLTSAEKITMDVDFVGLAHETRTGTVGVKSGTRPSLVEGDAFVHGDASRIRLALVDASNENPTAFSTYITDLSITISNNLVANKAIGTIGSVCLTTGIFSVSGSITAYFETIAAANSIAVNDSVSLDFAVVHDNAGMLVDIPLVTLGDGKPDLSPNEAIKLPLNMDAAKDDTLDFTMSISQFRYLPTLAAN